MQFHEWLINEEEIPQVLSAKGTPDNFYLLFKDGRKSGKVDHIVATPGRPGIYQIKDQNGQYAVNMNPTMGNKLLGIFWKKVEKPEEMWKVLGWPTPKMPPPPPYWTPEMMEMNHDNAGKFIANKLLQQGMDAKKAGLIGNKISEFIFYYSPYPPRVKNRVLMKLGDQYPDANAMELVKIANVNAQKAEPYHKMLKAKGYIGT